MQTSLIQAPAGGAVSPVNDQFYKGGEFMPDTGEFCGMKKMAKKFASTDGENWAEIVISNGLVSVRFAGSNRKQYLIKKPVTTEEAVAFATETLALRAIDYKSKGVSTHPTQLVIA